VETINDAVWQAPPALPPIPGNPVPPHYPPSINVPASGGFFQGTAGVDSIVATNLTGPATIDGGDAISVANLAVPVVVYGGNGDDLIPATSTTQRFMVVPAMTRFYLTVFLMTRRQ
jgi:hypothetical protein